MPNNPEKTAPANPSTIQTAWAGDSAMASTSAAIQVATRMATGLPAVSRICANREGGKSALPPSGTSCSRDAGASVPPEERETAPEKYVGRARAAVARLVELHLGRLTVARSRDLEILAGAF